MATSRRIAPLQPTGVPEESFLSPTSSSTLLSKAIANIKLRASLFANDVAVAFDAGYSGDVEGDEQVWPFSVPSPCRFGRQHP